MSKNPLKPNTSPDHVKETAEAFTCPSHIEARERAATIALRIEAAAFGRIYVVPEDATALRTLLATPTQGPDVPDRRELHAMVAEYLAPTQEGVGRRLDEDFELAERAFREGVADGYLAGRTDPADDPLTLHDDAINEAWTESETRKALGVREDALLPAPKPGEGELVPVEPTEAMLRAWYETKCKPSDRPGGGLTRWATWEEASAAPWFLDQMRACYAAMIAAVPKPQQPAPDAPEGWRAEIVARVTARLEKARADLKHADENRDGWFSTMPADLWQDMEDEIKLFEDTLAALTSSSAKPQEVAKGSCSLKNDACISGCRAYAGEGCARYKASSSAKPVGEDLEGTEALIERVHDLGKQATDTEWLLATRLKASAQSNRRLREGLDLPISWELSWGEVSDEEGAPCGWRVHERSGNRSDREWTLIATGETPLEALTRAHSLQGQG